MSSEKRVARQYEHLLNYSRFHIGEDVALTARLQSDGEEISVTNVSGGFNLYTGTSVSGEAVVESFLRNYPDGGSVMVSSDDGDSFRELDQLSGASIPEKYNAVKYIGERYGAMWMEEPDSKFSDSEHMVSVFSDDENFDYTADSAEVIVEVFPEITGFEPEDDILDEAMDLALLDLKRYR